MAFLKQTRLKFERDCKEIKRAITLNAYLVLLLRIKKAKRSTGQLVSVYKCERLIRLHINVV